MSFKLLVVRFVFTQDAIYKLLGSLYIEVMLAILIHFDLRLSNCHHFMPRYPCKVITESTWQETLSSSPWDFPCYSRREACVAFSWKSLWEWRHASKGDVTSDALMMPLGLVCSYFLSCFAGWQCAESALNSVLGDLSHTYFVGNAPMAHMVVQPTETAHDVSPFKVHISLCITLMDMSHVHAYPNALRTFRLDFALLSNRLLH